MQRGAEELPLHQEVERPWGVLHVMNRKMKAEEPKSASAGQTAGFVFRCWHEIQGGEIGDILPSSSMALMTWDKPYLVTLAGIFCKR